MKHLEKEERNPVASYTVYDYGDGTSKMQCAVHADAMHSVIWDILGELRSVGKYDEDSVKSKHYEDIRSRIFALLNEEGIGGLF